MNSLKDWLSNLVCPSCKATGSIRPIHYGAPGSQSDYDQMLVVENREGPFGHTHGCKECGWEGDFVDGVLIHPPLTLDEILNDHIELVMGFIAANPHIHHDSELRQSFIETALAQLQKRLEVISDWEFHK